VRVWVEWKRVPYDEMKYTPGLTRKSRHGVIFREDTSPPFIRIKIKIKLNYIPGVFVKAARLGPSVTKIISAEHWEV